MSSLKHWREQGAPPEFERLLSAARSEGPSGTSLQRALLAAGALGVPSLAAPTAAGAVGGATAKLTAMAAVKWIAVGLVGVGAVATTVREVGFARRQSAKTATTLPSQSPAHSSSRVADSGLGMGREQEVSPIAQPATAPAPERPRVVGVASSRPPLAASEPAAFASPERDSRASQAALGDARGEVTAASRFRSSGSEGQPTEVHRNGVGTLLEEMELIDSARLRLRAGDAAGTLDLAQRYLQRFPLGRFAPEALYLSLQGRWNLGQRQAAFAVARQVILHNPNGPHVQRAREILRFESSDEKP